jgi:hypothetical protein
LRMARMSIKVDLPAPEGPIRACGSSSKEDGGVCVSTLVIVHVEV